MQLVTSSISQHKKLNRLEKRLPGHEAGLTNDEDMDGCERMFSTLRFNNCTIRDGSSTDEHAVGSSHNWKQVIRLKLCSRGTQKIISNKMNYSSQGSGSLAIFRLRSDHLPGFLLSSGPLPARRGMNTPVPLDSWPDPRNTALIPDPPPLFAPVHCGVL
jgi:hypothetical protein